MANTEVEFEETERRLLDWLEAHASQRDGVVAASDTHMIRELGFEGEPHRFFAAKMRLVAAGVISLFVDSGGHAAIQLNMRERPSAVSKRYALLVVPLELVPEIIARTKAWRQEAFAPAGPEAALPPPVITRRPKPKPEPAPPPPPEKPTPPPAPKQARNGYSPEEGLRRGQARLGVRPVVPGPIRPPVRTSP